MPRTVPSRLMLLAPLLVCANCTILFEDSQIADDAAIRIDAALPLDAGFDASFAEVSCPDVMTAGPVTFNVSTNSLTEAPAGMTGMVVANGTLYLVDIGAQGSGLAPKIWAAQGLTEWLDASLLNDDRLVLGPINVGANRADLRLNEVSAPIAFAPNLGAEGSLLLVHEQNSIDDELRRRIARYDFESDTWSLLSAANTPILVSHSITVLGDFVYGIQHAGGDPIIRLDLTGSSPGTVASTKTAGLPGSDPQWMSRAAQLTAANGLIYAIKNDWCTPASSIEPGQPCAETGQRLFYIDPNDFDIAEPTVAGFSVPLPFEVGHGSTLVFVRPGWRRRVGPQGALFVTNGRAPSNHEGLAATAGNQQALYDIACDHWSVGPLPTASGSGASAVFFNDKIIVHPGGEPDQNSSNATLWVSQ